MESYVGAQRQTSALAECAEGEGVALGDRLYEAIRQPR